MQIVDILILGNKILNISLISSITVEEFIYFFFCDHTVPIKNNLLTKQLDQNSLYNCSSKCRYVVHEVIKYNCKY